MDESFEERLAAVERALTDTDGDRPDLATAAEVAERVDDLETDLAALTDRVAELEAATQALRGYVGNVRSVNEEVEQRADLALSKAEAASRAVADSSGDHRRQSRQADGDGSGPATGAGQSQGATTADAPTPDSPASAAARGDFAPSAPREELTDGRSFLDDDVERDPASLADEGDTAGTSGTAPSETGADDEAGVLARIRALV
ncbi:MULTISPECIES: DUF7310 family coiled-coil domain-containing protein [Salinibaculum]|uniref:DUF7310 family coiled-coil domain-containing protein n=1 Tax=Salinibaculum TaxID=2732368 RepID=UPI0030CD4F80